LIKVAAMVQSGEQESKSAVRGQSSRAALQMAQ